MTTKKSQKKVFQTIKTILSSNWFFAAIVIIFALQMIWIAMFSIYPMLFDEEYHLGIIDIYSRQISPFITNQPTEAAFHGDITRYGSYLFHYSMSGPYWLATQFTQDLQTIVIFIRLLCIAFVVAGVVVFRKFLLLAGLSKSATHLSIALFTFIPLVPFAFAQINYDSLAFLLIATIFYMTMAILKSKINQSTGMLLLLAISSLACLVKFTILPIAFACVLFVCISLYKKYRSRTVKHLLSQAKNASKLQLLLVSVLLLLGIGLFGERYGGNIVQYQTIEPKCDRIHSRESCMEYTVFRRDTTWREANEAKNTKRNNPAVYTTTYWAPHIFNDFFVVAAFVYDQEKPLEIRYLPTTMQASAGNKVLKYAGWVFLIATTVITVVLWRKLPLKTFRYLVVSVVAIYALSLWLRNYSDYMSIGTGTAAQGRYFLPFLIPIFAMSILAWNQLLTKPYQKIILTSLAVVLLSQGGGVSNYILYSNARWYWPEQRKVLNDINLNTRKVLRTYIPF